MAWCYVLLEVLLRLTVGTSLISASIAMPGTAVYGAPSSATPYDLINPSWVWVSGAAALLLGLNLLLIHRGRRARESAAV
ncbi:MAG: hypothetical protein A3G76_02285 [Acidobacteria bacterium RIFCSPLOWO2_12_FULL_65_11]|nr:MAG: hypothetical protein A3H95_13330 [Acidobacteria bacterium RIFCSPLOWO2_02_FULL_64_15]OFW31627.1 MAG: hypothetical protein A3G76_02285 [Acidobacteria bacterium RIFCSPLOWO2_12_FULL_65_11]